MAKQRLSLAALATINHGKLAAAFDRLIQEAIADCDTRAEDKSARTVKLELAIKPQEVDRGDCETLEVSFGLSSRLPGRKLSGISMIRTKANEAVYSDDSLSDPRQATFGDGE